jgi:hypothetical protein
MNANNAEINANADNAEEQQNAEPTALESLNGLIFDMYLDNTQFKEGDYLKLMNYTKEIFNDMKKIKEKQQPEQQPINRNNILNNLTLNEKVDNIIYREDKIFTLRRITREQTPTGVYYIRLFDEGLFMAQKTLRVGEILRIYESGTGVYKFIRLTKINEMSIKYNIMYYDGHTHIKRNNTLKFKDKDFYENFTSKNILIYNSSYALISSLYAKLIDNGDEEYEKDDLKITL